MTLEKRLAALADAAAAVRSVGLDDAAAGAESVVARATERVGFPGAVYVLALAGGTGVGKSSLLNALAGRAVSAVRAVRPTTEEPLAWLAEARRTELDPLLAWLGVRHVVGHADQSLSGVAILDLPDVDSVRTEHRARVDALLPRIDAVAWVVDPEKYDDERLHAYLRSLAPHASRMRFVLNKADRLSEAQRDELAGDLRRRLEASGIPDARIHVVSAADGRGIDALRTDLAAEADAKAVVAAKLETDAREALGELARALAIRADGHAEPLLPDARRAEATRAAVDGALAVVDPTGLARQVQSAVLARARMRGGSLLGRAVGILGWLTGQQRRRADPAAHLHDWRRRGTLGRAVNPIRAALLEAATQVPPASRSAILRATGADDPEAAIARALDAVARDATAELRVGGSWLWYVVGVAQLVAAAVFVFAIAWYVTLFVSSGQVPVATADLPLLGPIPIPLTLLVGTVVVSAILGFALSLHAGWIGRRHGRLLAGRVRTAVGDAIETVALGGLDRVEAVRRSVAGAISVE